MDYLSQYLSLTTEETTLLIAGALLLLSLLPATIRIFRSRKLVGQTDSQDLGLQPTEAAAGELSDWQVLWAALSPHLSDLRRTLSRSALALLIGIAVSFIFSETLLNILTEPIGGLSQLEAIEVTEPISVFMRVALTSGFILALPNIFAELWIFIAPALRENEFRYIYFTLPSATFLFLGGAAFAYFVMLPVSIPFLVNFMDIPATPRPANYIKFVTGLVFWVGISFETPLLALLLARLGLLTPATLIRNWRYAILIMALVSAVITPTVDPINMVLAMLPLLVLYLLSIVLVKVGYRERQ